jgi:hypothetical protein
VADPVTEFELYRQELMNALGSDDPLDVLRSTLAEIEQLTAAASADALDHQPAPGEWSPRQVLCHLADSDLVTCVRVRMIVTQDRPVLVGYDQDAWTNRFAGLDADATETVARWRVLRRANVHMYESLTADEWRRVGLHTERGEESVRLIAQMQAGHDRMHLDQLRRGLAAAANLSAAATSLSD